MNAPLLKTIPICSRCERPHGRVRLDGTAQSYCAACHAAYVRGWRHKERQELLRLRALAEKVAREAPAQPNTESATPAKTKPLTAALAANTRAKISSICTAPLRLITLGASVFSVVNSHNNFVRRK